MCEALLGAAGADPGVTLPRPPGGLDTGGTGTTLGSSSDILTNKEEEEKISEKIHTNMLLLQSMWYQGIGVVVQGSTLVWPPVLRDCPLQGDFLMA